MPETITILQTADLHANLKPHEDLFIENNEIVFRKTGGLAYVKTLVDSIRCENPDGTLLIDGGDFIQGSGEAALSEGRIFPPLIRAMKYDLLIPGNWEVVYGKEVMMDVMNSYGTQVIAANMFDEETDAPLFPPYWITEKKGVRIGFIAYNDPEVPKRQSPGFSEGMEFTPVEANLKELITRLKETEKVDVLLLVAHIGIFKELNLAENPAVEGMDYILGNDTHERIRKPLQGEYSAVVEPGAFGTFLGRLDLQVESGKIIGSTYELIEVSPDRTAPDPEMQRLISEAEQPYAGEMQRVLGHTATSLYRYLTVENPMDNFITDALQWKTKADFATSNGFRFGVPLIPDETGKKAITKADLWQMLPVDEPLKVGKVKGHQIKKWLEKELNNVFSVDYKERSGGWLVRFSGLTLRFDSGAEKDNRVTEVTIGGKLLVEDATYTMAACNRQGEPLENLCRLKNAEDVSIQSYTVHDAIEDYLSAMGTISPKLDERAVDTGKDTYPVTRIDRYGYVFR